MSSGEHRSCSRVTSAWIFELSKIRVSWREVNYCRLPLIDCVWNDHWSVIVLHRRLAWLVDRSQSVVNDRVYPRRPEISGKGKGDNDISKFSSITFSISIRLGGRTGGATDTRRPEMVGRRIWLRRKSLSIDVPLLIGSSTSPLSCTSENRVELSPVASSSPPASSPSGSFSSDTEANEMIVFLDQSENQRDNARLSSPIESISFFLGLTVGPSGSKRFQMASEPRLTTNICFIRRLSRAITSDNLENPWKTSERAKAQTDP